MEDYIVNDRRRQILITLVVAVSAFTATLDYSMLNISLPTIAKYYGITLAAVAWLPTIYLLVVTSSLLGFGKLGDIRGYKPLFIIGLAIFALGTILCGFTPNLNALLAFRAIQSVGEAMSSPIAIAIITYYLPADRRGLALGVVALAQGLGFAMGSAAGGYINAYYNWRAIFFINVPIVAATILFSLKILPGEQAKADDKRFDTAGAALIFVALASLLFFINSVMKKGFKDPVIIASIAAAAISFAIFIAREKKIAYPVLDLGLFRNTNFTFAVICTFLATFLLMGFIFLTPFYFELVRGMKVASVGFILMIAPIMMMLLAPVSGRLSDHIGSRILCSSASVMMCAAFIAFFLFDLTTNIRFIVIAIFVLGCAAGIFMAPNNKLVLLQAPPDRQGIASGVYKMFLNTGSVLGIALFPIAIMFRINGIMTAGHLSMTQVRQSPAIIQAGFRGAFLFAVLMSLLALIFSVLAQDKK